MRKKSEYVVEMTKEQFERLVDATWEEYNKEDLLADMVEIEEEE